ncbi:MAG: VCBS repeat-containing protein [Phycisphaerales bacterium]|nr:VCBS repeat-containing protein [Phycisphaerales bacterium]
MNAHVPSVVTGLLVVTFGGAALRADSHISFEQEPISVVRGGRYPSALDAPLRKHLVADLNHDGRPDILYPDGDVTMIAFQLPDGTFEITTLLPAASIRGAAAADFDGNGTTDLAVIREDLVQIRYVNALGGNFTGPVTIASAAGPDLAAADLNHDDRIDLVAGPDVLINSPTGPWSTLTINSAGPRFIADVNHDGHPDIIDRAHVFFNDGTATFTSVPLTLNVTLAAFDVRAVTDFNEDGFTDLVLANNRLHVCLGDGTGHFSRVRQFEATNPAAASITTTCAVADMNLDGHQDLIALPGTLNLEASLEFYPGDGGGGFSTDPIEVHAGGLSPSTIIVHDMNSDGRPDLVTDHSGARFNEGMVGEELVVALSGPRGPGVRTSRNTTFNDYIHNIETFGICAPDLDGDRRPDIITSLGEKLKVFFAADAPDLYSDVEESIVAPSSGQTFACGSFFGTASQQVIATDGNSRVNLLRSAPATFVPLGIGVTSYQSFTLPQPPLDIAIGDLNHDGRDDVVISTDADNPEIIVCFADTSGMLEFRYSYPIPRRTRAVAIGDINRDGRTDIVFATDWDLQELTPGGIHVLAQQSDSTFAPLFPAVNDLPGTPGALAADDLDLDGDLDIVVGTTEPSSVLIVYTWNGTGFNRRTPVPFDVPLTEVIAGDLDRDGVPEIVAASNRLWLDTEVPDDQVNRLWIFENNGDGTLAFDRPVIFTGPPSDAALRDMDGDGRLDIIAAVNHPATVNVAFNNSPVRCPGDSHGDHTVNFDDLQWMLEHWGQPAPLGTRGDVNGDQRIDFTDLELILQHWGAVCPEAG